MVIDDDDANEETSDGRQTTANDEELALQLQVGTQLQLVIDFVIGTVCHSTSLSLFCSHMNCIFLGTALLNFFSCTCFRHDNRCNVNT